MTYLVVAVSDTGGLRHNQLERELTDIVFVTHSVFNRILVDADGSPVAILTTEKVDAHVT